MFRPQAPIRLPRARMIRLDYPFQAVRLPAQTPFWLHLKVILHLPFNPGFSLPFLVVAAPAVVVCLLLLLIVLVCPVWGPCKLTRSDVPSLISPNADTE